MVPPDPLWHPVHLPDPDCRPGQPAICRLHRFKVLGLISAFEIYVAKRIRDSSKTKSTASHKLNRILIRICFLLENTCLSR